MSNIFDTSNAPETEPVGITAGNYTSWKRTDLGTDYPNTSYTLSYTARREDSTAQKINITAAADGDDYLVELASATTAAYKTGKYHWTAYITRDSDSARTSIDAGTFSVIADKATDSADPRSFAQRMVAKIEAAIEHRADNYQLDVLAYSLGVETSATRNPAELLKWRAHYKREVVIENRKKRAKAGKGNSTVVKARF